MWASCLGCFYLNFNNYTHIVYYLKTSFFLALETMFKTHHLLDLSKERVPDVCEEQPLPRKVI